jgi:hypothetical protein
VLRQPVERLPEHVLEPSGPFRLAPPFADQVLADLDPDMGEPAALAMDRQRVVALVMDDVRQLVAHIGRAFPVQELEQQPGETGVAIVQEPDQPRSREPLKTGVKLCIAISAVRNPSFARASSSASIAA